MTTYERAGQDVLDVVATTMETYHGHLRDAALTTDVLLAYGPKDADGDLVGPAIKRHGTTCAAQVRIINLRDRVAGRSDVEIMLDGDRIDEWSDEQLAAIIDHELTHLELKVADEGVKRDDIERPCLRLREHDHEFGWFDSVARRHGEHAIEVQQARQLLERDELRQLYLPGLDVGAA